MMRQLRGSKYCINHGHKEDVKNSDSEGWSLCKCGKFFEINKPNVSGKNLADMTKSIRNNLSCKPPTTVYQLQLLTSLQQVPYPFTFLKDNPIHQDELSVNQLITLIIEKLAEYEAGSDLETGE